jgi:predicted RecB family nuclease
MKKLSGSVVYSPSDLVRYFASPFASWMDRYHLERPGEVKPDEETEDQKLIAETGNQHERNVLAELKTTVPGLHEIAKRDFDAACAETAAALAAKAPIVFQAALEHAGFAGFADFVMLEADGRYQVWDTKLARSPKPYYAIQLCCYSEMLAAVTGDGMPEKFGIILGSNERVEFRIEDFMHFYRQLKAGFLTLQNGFTPDLAQRPEPLPRADHGRWSSHAEALFLQTDHLVQVAGISVGQMKKLRTAGVHRMAELAGLAERQIPKTGR